MLRHTMLQKTEVSGSIHRTLAQTNMHLQQRAFTLTMITIMCSTPVKSTEPTKNPVHSAELTENVLVPSADVGRMEIPRVLKLLGLCSGNDQEFCLNGHCSYHPDLSKPTCSCPQNFGGERCEHMLLDTHSEDNPEKLIAVGLGVALLLCCLIAVLYCSMKKRCQKEKPYQICHSDLSI